MYNFLFCSSNRCGSFDARCARPSVNKMQQRSKILLGAAIALAGALTIYLIATAPKPSDKQQITDSIEIARGAVQHHNATTLLTVVSADYKDPLFANIDQLHFFMVRILKNAGPIRVSTSATAIDVIGDTAKSTTHVVIKSADGNNTFFDGNVNLAWQREQTHRYLVFPSTTWRVTTAQYPNVPNLSDD